MADFASALFARLTGDAGVTAIVGTKVFWNIVPQNTQLPYIRMQTISDPRPEHLKGLDAARVTRVQVDCFAAKYGTAREMSEKVITATRTPGEFGGVQFGRVKPEGPRDLGEDTSAGIFVHRASMDLLVAHRLA